MSEKRDSSRSPLFLAKSTERRVAIAQFRGMGKAAPSALRALANPSPVAALTPPPAAAVTDVAPAPAPPPPAIDYDKIYAEATAGIAVAVSELEATAARLAHDARHDAVELGFLVARRIVEAELATNREAMASLVRSAIRRLGESKKVIVRLCAADADVVNALIAERKQGVVAGPQVAHVEVVADPSLERGDVLVEGDMASVDGRLGTRLEELRRALKEAGVEEGP